MVSPFTTARLWTTGHYYELPWPAVIDDSFPRPVILI
jgi:hypothetical protein